MHQNIRKLMGRASPPTPWSEGETIPWNDPAFSRRMLREHLSQAHDAASRRTETIEAHVAYIRTLLPEDRPARILDLGCGPGLYAQRLAAAGHQVRGIDFSPASIEYARAQAISAGLVPAPNSARRADEGQGPSRDPGGSASKRAARAGRGGRGRSAGSRTARPDELGGPGTLECVHADMREAEFGAGYDLAMLIFGEFNDFQPHDARRILGKIHDALSPGGQLLLEPHPFDAVRSIGRQPARWSTNETGLFSDRPYLYLEESFWDPKSAACTTRYFILDAESGDLTRHSSSMQAYTDDEYRALLETCGFKGAAFEESLTGSPDGAHPGLFVIRAEK